MKLDRNINQNGRGKYALIKLRQSTIDRHLVTAALSTNKAVEVEPDAIDFGYGGNDFFVIRIKDKYAGPALRAYADAARTDDPEYAAEIDVLAQAAEEREPKRIPD